MKRDNWVFDIPAKKLIEASKKKVEWHSGRLEHWTKTQASVMAEVKEKGMTVSESQGGSGYNSNTGMGPQIVINETYQTKLYEATQKMKEHRNQLSAYNGWVQVLEENADKSYQLNSDDYLYFFGK